MTNHARAFITSPGIAKYSMIDPKMLIYVMKARKIFLRLPLSAITPMIGDKIATTNGLVEITEIESKEMNDPEMPLYNFHVSNDQSYIADDNVNELCLDIINMKNNIIRVLIIINKIFIRFTFLIDFLLI